MAAVGEDPNYVRFPNIHDVPHHGNGTPNGRHDDVAMDISETGNSVDRKSMVPSVIVRDVFGRPLDVNTTYQRAIYEAKWKFSQGEFPQKSEEWRLPHAPLPARPDYTRTAPPLAMQQIYKKELKKANKLAQSYPEFSETIDTVKGYENLRWSLRQAETLPPLAGAQLINKNSCHVPPKTYLPFVRTAPSANRILLQTDIREAEYEFPGFCSGCTKGTGLCYGCDKDSKPHFHRDKVARTGGGFVYLKHDRAYGIIASKNPANWNVDIPEPERRRLEEYLYPQYPEDPGHRQWLPAPPKLPPTAYVFYDDVVHPDFKKYGPKVSVVRLRDKRDETFVDEVGMPYDPDKPEMASRIATYLIDTGYDEMPDRPIPVPEATAPEEHDDVIREVAVEEDLTLGDGSRQSTKTTTESGVSGRAKSQSLYIPPPPFKLKPSEKKLTIAVDPFSDNRQYNIPTGDGIDIKKSDKPLTEFEEFRFGEGDWQEPKFEAKAKTDVTPSERSRPPAKVILERQPKSDVTGSEQSYEPPVAPPPPPTGEISTEPTTLDEEKGKETPLIVDELPKPKSADSVLPAPREGSVSEATLTEQIVGEIQGDKSSLPEMADNTSSSIRTASPVTESDTTTPSPTKREKKPRPPIVKKERKQREPPVRRSRAGSVKQVIEEEPEPIKEKTPTPEPKPEEKHEEPESESELEPVLSPIIFKEHSLPTPPPMRKVAPPPLPRAAPPVPPIPREYTDVEKPKREVSQTLIEAPPPMYEPPKQKRPPPVKRSKAKNRERRLPVIRPSEVPREQPEIKRVVDPLDYLAKYCIIHKDRLPHYERVFNKVIKEQQYRYIDVPHDEENKGSDVTAKSESPVAARPIKTHLTSHEEKMINDFILINRSTREEYAMVGYNIGDQNVQKVNFTLDTLINKYEELQEKHDRAQADRILMIANFAKKMFPEVLNPNYKGEKKKKKKKSNKKKKSEEGQSADGTTAEAGVQTEIETEIKEPRRLTEIDIVRRLSQKMLDEISKQPEIARINLEIERLQEKLRDVDDRIEDLEDEKKLLQLYSRDLYLSDLTKNKRELTFLRKQSALYQKMHPNEDPEMNLSELEDALQQINGHLISEKELQFIYHILDLKSRRRINLQLFCVVAALSEKVKQVDPFVRKLINKFNYEALNVKMDKSKELFWLLDGESDEVPSGMIPATSLAVELAAGGVSPEHTQFVVNKFNRESKGTVDFLDYLTYVPLFIELHGRIVDDPLSSKRVY